MERELLETFEAARKAAHAAAEAGGGEPEAVRCVDALRRLGGFRVTTGALVYTQVGKKLRSLTKHPHSGIQAVASELLVYWNRIVMEEADKKKDTTQNGKSNNTAVRAGKAPPMKAEKVSASASVNKRDVCVRGMKSESAKVEKIVNKGTKVQPVKVEKVSKEVGAVPDTGKPSSVLSGPPKLTSLVKCNDAIRDKIRELLADAFSRVAGEARKDDREEVKTS